MLELFYGPDAYQLRTAVSARVTALRAAHGSALTVTSVDCADDDAIMALERPLKYPSFFDEPTIIVARNPVSESFTDIRKRYDLNGLPDIIILAVQNTSGLRATKALTTIRDDADTAHALEPLNGKHFITWMTGYASKRGATLDPAAAAVLSSAVGEDMSSAALELDKLCAFARGGVIGTDAVHTLTPRKAEHDEWALSNALAAHDKRGALAALWQRAQEGAPEQLLLGSVAAGIRNLLMVNDLRARHQPAAAIARATGLHPFIVSKTLRGAATADAVRLRRAHAGLAQLDRDGKDGRADVADGLFSLLLSL